MRKINTPKYNNSCCGDDFSHAYIIVHKYLKQAKLQIIP